MGLMVRFGSGISDLGFRSWVVILIQVSEGLVSCLGLEFRSGIRSRVRVSFFSLRFRSWVRVSSLISDSNLMFRFLVQVSCSGLRFSISSLGFQSWVGVLGSGLRGLVECSGLKFRS